MISIHPIETIVSDPAVHDGQPIIAGTRIRVAQLVASMLYRGLSPDDLALNYGLDLGQVYATLAWYYQHRVEVDDQLRADEERTDAALAVLESQGKLTRIE